MGINIRSLEPTEDEEVFTQIAELFAGMYQYMNNLGLVQQLVPGGHEVWVNAIKKSLGKLNSIYIASKDDKIVGFAAGNLRLLPAYLGSKKVGYISHVYIIPEYRKQLIAKDLVLRLEQWFEEKKVSFVELEVLSENKSAYRFWEKSGFSLDSYKMLKYNEKV